MSSLTNQLNGTGVALITPFTTQGYIDFDALSGIIDHVINGGVEYIVTLGTTGETPTLEKKEKTDIIKFTYEKVNNRVPVVVGIGGNNTKELLDYFERSLAEGKKSLMSATENDLLPNWTLRNGDQVYSVSTKYEVIRMSFGQIIHHRAQLGVYLRLLNIPIPGSYGPSADEMNF